MPSAQEPGTSSPAGRVRARPGGAPNHAAETAERLKAIIRDASTPEDALEPSLRWIGEASGGAAGALCYFDQRKELLRLAAECNLSDEGCRRLRSVRRGDVAGWDMPLHGLLNRRAYLIDSAAKNRYVPPLIEPPSQVRSIVCLPLYQGNTALGSLLIVATGVRVLMERDIRTLEPALRELSTLIEAIRLRVPTLAPAARPAAVTPIAAGPTPPPDVARIRGADAGEAESASGVLMEVIELRSKVQELRGQVATVETATEEERQRAGELAAKLRDTAAALKKAQAGERALQEQLDAARATPREDLAARLAEVERRAEEQARRAADLEVQLRAALRKSADVTAKLELATAAQEHARARERALQEQLDAARSAPRGDVPTRLAEIEARAEEQARRAADLEAQLTAALRKSADVAALESRLSAAEASVETERARAEAATRSIEATAGAREYGDAELAATNAVVGSLKAQLEEQRKELERLEPVAHAAESLERDLRATREREVALRASKAALEAEVAALRASASGAEPAAARATGTIPAAPSPADTAAEIAAPAAAESTPAPPPSRASGQSASGIVVIDTGGAWGRLGARAGVRVETPDEQLGERIAASDARLLVNLAAPGALHAVARLRGAGDTRRFWGCLATPDAGRALPLGMIEPAVRPLAPEALVALLEGYAARGTRVVTLGRDIDAFGGFRQSMARQGLSVSMAWDAKQAADVIAMVRPEVAVVDLESLREGCGIVAGLAGAEPLPHLVLLFGAKDPAPGFAHAVRDPAHASRALPLDRLVAELAKRSETPPVERR